VRDTLNLLGGDIFFLAVKVPKYCPLVFLVKQVEEKLERLTVGKAE
jgi:hypothetical protein